VQLCSKSHVYEVTVQNEIDFYGREILFSMFPVTDKQTRTHSITLNLLTQIPHILTAN